MIHVSLYFVADDILDNYRCLKLCVFVCISQFCVGKKKHVVFVSSHIVYFCVYGSPEGVPSVLTVLNTMAEAERNTEQNNKDNQCLFAAT